MVGLDGTAVVIAAPWIGQTVHASHGELQWIANAYLVALALGLLPGGRLADRFGRRRAFVVGMLAFGALSLLIALSANPTVLIAFRAAQGLAGALMQPAALALLRTSVPGNRLDLAIGVLTAATATATAGGPVVAGAVVEHAGWPAVFIMNVPLALLGAVVARVATAESRASTRTSNPATSLVRMRGIRPGLALVGASYFAIYGLLFFLTFYLQNLRGLDPVTAGAWIVPLSGAVVLSAPLGGLAIARFGPRWPAISGMSLLCLGLVGLSWLDATTTMGAFLAPALLGGLGAGLALVAGTRAVIAVAPATMSGLASAVQQVAGQVGGVLGVTVLGVVMSWRVGEVLPRRLDETALPQPVADSMLASADSVAQGLVTAPAGTPEPFAALVVTAGRLAFVDGFHATLLTAALVAAGGAAIGLAVRSAGEPARPPHPPADVHGECGHEQGAHHEGV